MSSSLGATVFLLSGKFNHFDTCASGKPAERGCGDSGSILAFRFRTSEFLKEENVDP
jgi:hypothetical protein